MDNEKKIDGKLKELIMEWKFLGLSMEKLCEVILEKININVDKKRNSEMAADSQEEGENHHHIKYRDEEFYNHH